MSSGDKQTTKEKAELHDTLNPLLEAMYSEFKDLSKKKPDAAVNRSKISIVNRLLTKIRIILDGEASLEFLDLLNEDDIPQVSDVTLMLSQYVSSMKKYKDECSNSYNGTWVL